MPKANQPVIKANSNFHLISGGDSHRQEGRYKEYRKRWMSYPENFIVGEFPLFIDIEVTSACNLKCPFCATTFRGSKIEKGFAPFEMVKKIIDEGASRGLYGVKFNIRGEPLLHPRICDMVKYAKAKGLLDVYFNTNAVLLTEETAGKLIDAGLDRISISAEGYTKDVYEKHRVGAKFEDILENMASLQSMKKRMALSHPRVRVQTVMLPEFEQHFDKYKEFWAPKADEVGYLDYKEMKDKKRGVIYSWACPQLWQRLAIWWDGTIVPCNHDDDALMGLGNVNKISVKEAWDSVKLNRMRDMHKKGVAHEITACDGCYLRDSEISKLKKGNGAVKV